MTQSKKNFRQKLPTKLCADPLEQILQVITAEVTNTGKATTRRIAVQVMLSESQVWRYLIRLEQAGCVRRIGQRGGWVLVAHSPCHPTSSLGVDHDR